MTMRITDAIAETSVRATVKVMWSQTRIEALLLTIKITDERHPEPPESRTDVRAAHSVHRLVCA